MKKQLLTAAVAAAVALPMIAQAGVYGRNDGVVRYVDNGSDETWDIGIDKMRWGIVGSEDLGNGMKALYHYEWQVFNGESNASRISGGKDEELRLGYVGLEGGWGKLIIGRNWVPSYGAVWSLNDIFDTWGTVSSQDNLSGNRIGSQLQYYTPNMSGFTAAVAVVLSNEDGSTNEDGVDLWEIVGQYKNGPLSVGATFRNDQRDNASTIVDLDDIDFDATNPTDALSAAVDSACGTNCKDTDVWGIGASYAFGAFKVQAVIGNSDPGSNGAETDVWSVGGSYNMGDNNITAAYYNNELDGGREIDTWSIGFNHFLSKETRIAVEYLSVDDDSKSDEVDTLAFALRKDWKL